MNQLFKIASTAGALFLSAVTGGLGEEAKYVLLDPKNPSLVTIVWLNPADPQGDAEIRIFDGSFASSCGKQIYATKSGTVRKGQKLLACTRASASSPPKECQCGR